MTVRTNNLLTERGGHIVWEHRASDAPGGAPTHVLVRATAPVRAALAAAHHPIRIHELTATLCDDFVGTDPGTVQALLRQLVRQRLLLTSVRPPMTAADPLAWMIAELDAACGATPAAGAGLTVARLRGVAERVGRHDESSTWAVAAARRRDLAAAAQQLRAVAVPALPRPRAAPAAAPLRPAQPDRPARMGCRSTPGRPAQPGPHRYRLPADRRFGGPDALAAAEDVFAADSAAALAQLAATGPGQATDGQAVTAASLLDLTIAVIGDPGEAMRWLIEHTRPHRPAPQRAIYDHAVALANPHDDGRLAALPGGTRILAAWRRRHATAATYRHTLHRLNTPAQVVLADLLHLHHTRIAGPDIDGERRCLHLARAAALSWTSRPIGQRGRHP